MSRVAFVCALASLCTGCAGGAEESMTSDLGGTTHDEQNTTLPVTLSASTDPSISVSAESSGAPTTGGAGTGSSSTGEPGSGSTSTGDDAGASSSSTGGGEFLVEWCILQFPPEIIEAAGVSTAVYARVYVEGITDETEFVDEHPQLVSEFGYGDDGSDPSVASWTWFPGEPNPGWDGSMAGGFGNENNDEYQYDLSFASDGTYDYAARFSADAGRTWVYCDLDDSETGGYSADQAGNAVIG